MPKYVPQDDEMDGGYSNAPVSPPDEISKPDDTESVDEQNAGEDQILIAKTKLPSGTKEGDTCTFKVAKDFGDEFSLTYLSESKEGEGEQTRDNMDATTESEISALDNQEGQ